MSLSLVCFYDFDEVSIAKKPVVVVITNSVYLTFFNVTAESKLEGALCDVDKRNAHSYSKNMWD